MCGTVSKLTKPIAKIISKTPVFNDLAKPLLKELVPGEQPAAAATPDVSAAVKEAIEKTSANEKLIAQKSAAALAEEQARKRRNLLFGAGAGNLYGSRLDTSRKMLG